VDGRARIVHGAAYAAFVAFNELLPVQGPRALAEFKTFLIAHAAESVRTVDEQVNVNQCWKIMMDAFRSDKFGVTPAERRRFFKFVADPAAKCPVSEHQMKIGADHPEYAWTSGKLYIQHGAVLDIMRKHLRERGMPEPLNQPDLLAQMRTRPYWVSHGTLRGHQQIFTKGSRVKVCCWCIAADRHELGYQAVTDAEFDASLKQDGAGMDQWVPPTDWADPRKGDLFALIQSLQPLGSAGQQDNE